MPDLSIWILTHKHSDWDVGSIEKDCLSAFADQELSVQVRSCMNPDLNGKPMPAADYLISALKTQFVVGNSRLAKHFSISTLWWQLRQLIGLGVSVLKLISQKHVNKVALESSRASRISAGHISMWKQASLGSSRLHLFLEDDVKLVDKKQLQELTNALLNFGTKHSQFICDCSHSYSLEEIGVDRRFANSREKSLEIMDSYDFPFTNTLAANFVSPELLNRTVSAVADRQGTDGLGIDLDLLYLWTAGGFNSKGCISTHPIFQQQSGFRNQKL
jgi:hypothetical protein